MRKPQTQIEGQSTKCLYSTIQKWKGQKRQGKTEKLSQIKGDTTIKRNVGSCAESKL